jgi:Holliday junction resolvase-like predicted endonuclease
MFARLGYNVAVQYGANQPEYDLMVNKGTKILMVSVKGTQEPGWLLAAKKKHQKSVYEQIDIWLKGHTEKTIFSLVQFRDKQLLEMPTIYLATPSEIAKRLKEAYRGEGKGVLYEDKTYTAVSRAAGIRDFVPPEWKFNEKRVEDLIKNIYK